jgi:aspartate aminotransferase
MVKLAARTAIPASKTIMMSQRADELKRQGVDVVSLTVGEPDFNTPDPVKEAAKRALDENFTRYTASAGIVELREAIAQKSRRENHIPTDAAHTLVTPTKHALFASIMATVDAGDEVLMTDPCFVSYPSQVQLAGGKPVWVPLRKEHAYGLRADDVQAKITKKTKLLMLCSPNNPTGMTDDARELRAIVDLANDHDLLLCSDEIYEKILYEGAHVSPASLPGGAERTITINGLSKSYAMTGWRTGWLHAPSPVFEAIAKIQTQTITQVTSFVQKASITALQSPPDSVTKMVAEFRARRDLIVEEIRRTPGLEILPPKGAFYAWPRFSHKMTSDAMAEHLLEKARVATVSGSAFGPSGEGHLRLSYATSRANIQEAFKRIREALPGLESNAVAAKKR